MDLLLILFATTALVALWMVAERIGRDLSPSGRFDHHAEWPGNDDRPMRLELLARSPEELAGIRGDRVAQTARPAAREAPTARPFEPTTRESAFN